VRYPASSAAAYRGVPGARIELLQGVGHTPMLEDPQTTGTLLLDFAAAAAHPKARPSSTTTEGDSVHCHTQLAIGITVLHTYMRWLECRHCLSCWRLDALHRLEQTFYDSVLTDPLLQPLFGAGQPEHVDHLTAFTAESFGGPDRFTRETGFAHLIDVHRGLKITEVQRARFVELYMAALDAAGMPADPAFREACGSMSSSGRGWRCRTRTPPRMRSCIRCARFPVGRGPATSRGLRSCAHHARRRLRDLHQHFRCQPEDQDAVVAFNIDIVDQVARQFPGFISATVTAAPTAHGW